MCLVVNPTTAAKTARTTAAGPDASLLSPRKRVVQHQLERRLESSIKEKKKKHQYHDLFCMILVSIGIGLTIAGTFMTGRQEARRRQRLEEEAWKAWEGQLVSEREFRQPTWEEPTSIPAKSQAWEEGLIHPAFLTLEESPKKVAVGVAPCNEDDDILDAILEQVLMYTSIESVSVLHSSPSCSETFADSRVETVLLSEISREKEEEEEEECLWDVLIMLPNHEEVMENLWLMDEVAGVVLTSLGKAVTLSQSLSHRPLLVKELQATDYFEDISIYEHVIVNPRTSRRQLWNFMAAFCEKRPAAWFASEAILEVHMQKRLFARPTTLDPPQLQSFHYPSRIQEYAECPKCWHGFDPRLENIARASLFVGNSTVPNAGRGLFTRKDIAKGSILVVEDCINSITLPHEPGELLEDMVDFWDPTEEDNEWLETFGPSGRTDREILAGPITSVFEYFEGYGFDIPFLGSSAMQVDSGVATFVNHGCNGTFNVGGIHSWTEWDLSAPLTRRERKVLKLDHKAYYPHLDRNIRSLECQDDFAMRDIHAGEELFNNYLEFVPIEQMGFYAQQLQQECNGELGSVLQYEAKA